MLFSVYDFGGQAVYYDVHRLMISRFAVYLVVFNLENFSLGDAERQRECLSYLRYWLTEIAGTCVGFNDSVPVLLVGTHKESFEKVRVDDFKPWFESTAENNASDNPFL